MRGTSVKSRVVWTGFSYQGWCLTCFFTHLKLRLELHLPHGPPLTDLFFASWCLMFLLHENVTQTQSEGPYSVHRQYSCLYNFYQTLFIHKCIYAQKVLFLCRGPVSYILIIYVWMVTIELTVARQTWFQSKFIWFIELQQREKNQVKRTTGSQVS